MKRRLANYTLLVAALIALNVRAEDGTVIEEQLAEIGTIPNEEIIVVQRKYTSKDWRHEFTPVIFGGVPFGTVRRTLLGGASYSLHASDSWAFEVLNFSYTKTFFSSFTDDINNNKTAAQAPVNPDVQKILYFLTTGIQWTPLYGKLATFSRWIAYVEPFVSLSAGMARTETQSYLTIAPGIGLRAFFREWFSMKLEWRDYLFSERSINRATGNTETKLSNNYSVTLSLSFWLPKMPL